MLISLNYLLCYVKLSIYDEDLVARIVRALLTLSLQSVFSVRNHSSMDCQILRIDVM